MTSGHLGSGLSQAAVGIIIVRLIVQRRVVQHPGHGICCRVKRFQYACRRFQLRLRKSINQVV